MGIKPLAWMLALCLGTPGSAGAEAVVERIGDVTVDFSRGLIRVPGQAAPNLGPPSAKVARAAAEQTARRDAARRLQRTLAALSPRRRGCPDAAGLPPIERAIERAAVSTIDWGSDGSVALELTLPAALLVMTGTRSAAGTAPVEPTLVVVDPKVVPALFRGERCADARPAPPVFATLREAAEQIPAVLGARIVAAGEAAGTAEVLAIVRRRS